MRKRGDDSPITLTGEAGLASSKIRLAPYTPCLRARQRLMMEVGFGVSLPSRRRFHGEPVIR
ncbi:MULTISPECIES: hypothetical protein [Mesorhizobium]|uniref:hypothetical protein n=1 Tax=Mesorhizobium TaxID=68287 RepID=UPI000AF81F82|nr:MULTISPECIES: hypothetical protein [Mesorhizobium]